jgi:thioredoxin 1
LAIQTGPQEIKKQGMVNKMNFNRKLAEGKPLSLVQFKTEWNGASQIISMIYDDLARSYKGMVDFHVIDFEEETDLSKAFGVTEVPTILFFKSGQIIDHAVGLIPKNVLIAKIEMALNNSNSK